MVKIAVLVSGGGTNLQALIDAQQNGLIKNGYIACVISSKSDAFALKRAEVANIPGIVVPVSEYPNRAEYTKVLLDTLKEQKIQLIVLAGFLYILDSSIIEAYPNAIINVHPSLIPSFCGEGYYGLRVHQSALDRGVKLTGATVHFVNEIADGGPIILQKTVEVNSDDTPELLQKRVMEEAEWKLLPQAVSLFCEGKLEVKNGKVIIID